MCVKWLNGDIQCSVISHRIWPLISHLLTFFADCKQNSWVKNKCAPMSQNVCMWTLKDALWAEQWCLTDALEISGKKTRLRDQSLLWESCSDLKWQHRLFNYFKQKQPQPCLIYSSAQTASLHYLRHNWFSSPSLFLQHILWLPLTHTNTSHSIGLGLFCMKASLYYIKKWTSELNSMSYWRSV